MSNLKAYIYKDDLFCYTATVIAENELEAWELFNMHELETHGWNADDRRLVFVTERPLEKGFLVEGGGNG